MMVCFSVDCIYIVVVFRYKVVCLLVFLCVIGVPRYSVSVSSVFRYKY